jgi:alkylation response protein AidB-like acyl-CoA dehydrogenase
MDERLRSEDETIRLLRESAGAVAPRGGSLARIRALRFTLPGFSREVWQEMGRLGWFGLRLPEEEGGAGLGMEAFCALAEELGQGLVPEPVIPAVMCLPFLPPPLRDKALAGEIVVLPAFQEEAGRLIPVRQETHFQSGLLSGQKRFIPMAAGADHFVVAAAEGLALGAKDAEGVSLVTAMTQDGGHFGTLSFEDAAAEPLPGSLAEALEEAALATAAYLLGLADRVFLLTLDYLRTREQFGRKIGSFQALQHRAADLKLALELTRASLWQAARRYDAADTPPDERRRLVSQAKARASRTALEVTAASIQLHGGIAYTDEYDAGLFLRKAMVIAPQFGTAAWHADRFAALSPEEEET